MAWNILTCYNKNPIQRKWLKMNKNKTMDQGLKEDEGSLRARNIGENKMAVNKERVTTYSEGRI